MHKHCHIARLKLSCTCGKLCKNELIVDLFVNRISHSRRQLGVVHTRNKRIESVDIGLVLELVVALRLFGRIAVRADVEGVDVHTNFFLDGNSEVRVTGVSNDTFH